MKFAQLDRILSIEKGRSITGTKCLSLSEEYLQDHFPRYAVMPGVLMMESVFQAAMYLIRHSDDYRYSMITLRESRNVKFQGFVRPGDTLVVNVNYQSVEGHTLKVKFRGEIDGNLAVSGVMVLERFNLVEKSMGSAATDAYICNQFRQKFALLLQPERSGPESNHSVSASAAEGSV